MEGFFGLIERLQNLPQGPGGLKRKHRPVEQTSEGIRPACEKQPVWEQGRQMPAHSPRAPAALPLLQRIPCVAREAQMLGHRDLNATDAQGADSHTLHSEAGGDSPFGSQTEFKFNSYQLLMFLLPSLTSPSSLTDVRISCHNLQSWKLQFLSEIDADVHTYRHQKINQWCFFFFWRGRVGQETPLSEEYKE